MGCMAIRNIVGFTEYWCDGMTDDIDEWIDKKYGKVDLSGKKNYTHIFNAILKDKKAFMQGYNLIKKSLTIQGKPKRDMTLFEYMYHLNFALGSSVNLDTIPLPPYLHRELGKTGKDMMYGGSLDRNADRAVFTFSGEKPIPKNPEIQKPKVKFNPYAGL